MSDMNFNKHNFTFISFNAGTVKEYIVDAGEKKKKKKKKRA